MARFIGKVRGGRGEVTRLGTPASGIEVTANGWNVGVRVTGLTAMDVNHKAGRGANIGDRGDVFFVFATTGSNRRGSDIPVAVIHLDKSGAVVAETSTEYNARLEREEAAEKVQAKALYVNKIGGKIFRLCNYHTDGLGWDSCSDGSAGCQIEEARAAVTQPELVPGARAAAKKKIGTVVYRDRDQNGESFTVYEGDHCLGTFLADDPTLAKYVAAIGGEKNITGGLNNR